MASIDGCTSLLDLPLEVVVLVIDCYTDDRLDKQTLCALACTCKVLQAECEKKIYQKLHIESYDDLYNILGAFAGRPERLAIVETLRILYTFRDQYRATLEARQTLYRYMTKMTALKTFHVESPYDNFDWHKGGDMWVNQDMEAFRQALEKASLHADNGRLTQNEHIGFSKLEKLIVHSHGVNSDFWHLGDFHCLFRHPRLRYLHVSCLFLTSDLSELEPYAKTTPLSTLVFDECMFRPKILQRILATPKHLKELTLGENCYNLNDHPATIRLHKLSKTPAATLDALKEVSHSLETLVHRDPLFNRTYDDVYKLHPIAGDGLHHFHRLKVLDIDPVSFLHQLVRTSNQAPPNLEVLRIHHGRDRNNHISLSSPPDLFRELPNQEPYTRLGSLKLLEFIQASSLERDIVDAGYICEIDALRERHAYAYKLWKQGIDMRLWLEAVSRDSYIPPHLWGETKPVFMCVYDSKYVGFRRHIMDLRVMPSPEEVNLARCGYHPDEAANWSPPELLEKLQNPRDPPETDQLLVPDLTLMCAEVERMMKTFIRRLRQTHSDTRYRIPFTLDFDPSNLAKLAESESWVWLLAAGLDISARLPAGASLHISTDIPSFDYEGDDPVELYWEDFDNGLDDALSD